MSVHGFTPCGPDRRARQRRLSPKGDATVIAEPQVWKGTEGRFTSLSQCAARLRGPTKPFLNRAGKAERQQITVPMLPLFVHERHSTQAIFEPLKSHEARGQTLDLFGDLDLDIADRLPL